MSLSFVDRALFDIASHVGRGDGPWLGVGFLDPFPRIRLRDHPPDRGYIGRRVLGVEIAPRHLLGVREFAFEGKDESEILAHRFVGIVLCRGLL